MAKFKNWIKVLLVLLIVYLLISLVLGIYWSMTPSFTSSKNIVEKYAIQNSNSNTNISGVATSATSIYLIDTLLNKPGGFIYNDVTLPGLYLDNMPNWEFGVLEQVRGLALYLRNEMTRSQTQSEEDKNLQEAQTKLNISSSSWMFPAAESEYASAQKYLQKYLDSLTDDDLESGKFYARADNLAKWLAYVSPQLGSLSQRLAASTEEVRVNTNLASDKNATSNKPETTLIRVKTPWNKIDDNFFEARGTAYALIHILKAVEIDFAKVLEDKNAIKSLQQVIRELESTQKPLRSPMILNGSGFGFFANHSLVMSSYITRANAAIIELINLLKDG